MSSKALALIALVFFATVGVMNYFHQEVSSYNQYEYASREITRICDALEQREVTVEQVCNTPIPKIAVFRDRFEHLRSLDGTWFAGKGWSYYPSVTCQGGHVDSFNYMDRSYRCDGSSVVAVDDASLVAAENAPSATCYKDSPDKPVRTILEIQDDGTIVLENKERVKLFGIDLPKQKSVKDDQVPCDETVRFIKARLEGQAVYVVSEEGAERDTQFRLPVFLITYQGEFFNQELVRLGLAAVTPPGADGKKHGCYEDFLTVERQARGRKLGLWGSSCFESQ